MYLSLAHLLRLSSLHSNGNNVLDLRHRSFQLLLATGKRFLSPIRDTRRFKETCLLSFKTAHCYIAPSTVSLTLYQHTPERHHTQSFLRSSFINMPQHKRGPWSATEDQYLLHLVNLHGAHNWVRISSTIGSRSPKQCRERYHQNLKPNLNHDPITPEEGILIEQMVAEMGKRWAEIARRLRGRSDNAVKNWWNGGMNRRRRSNNSRRQEVSVRQPVQQIPPTVSQQQIPTSFQAPQHIPQVPHIPQHFFQQPMYQPAQMQYAQRMSVSSSLQPYRQGSLIETPLPSPSAFSQMSADGAPSMVSDRSSISGRSPHNNGSPIELPPLSSNHNERRQQPPVPQYNFNAPNMYSSEGDFQVPTMHITRFEDQQKQPHMLQEPFMPTHHQMYNMQQPQYMQPAAPRQPSPMQQYQMQQQYQQQAPAFIQQRQPSYQISPLPASVQLPRINDIPHVAGMHGKPQMSLEIDPALMHGTPIPSVHTPDGSPKDKMSLSNITL